MLLLQQIDEIRRRAHPKEALHGVEDDVEFPLRQTAKLSRATCDVLRACADYDNGGTAAPGTQHVALST